MKKLLNQNNILSYIKTPFYLLFYRFYLTIKNTQIYLTTPSLLLLEILYVCEETVSWIISLARFKQSLPHETYGTISFFSIRKIFNDAHIKNPKIVCDLGSGKGKFLLFCMIYFNCKTVGVESNKYYNFIYGVLIRFFFKNNSCELIKNSILNHQIPSCDVLFCSGLCFDKKTLEYIQFQLNTSPVKPTFISVGVKFNLEGYSIQKEILTELSWGKEKVFIYLN